MKHVRTRAKRQAPNQQTRLLWMLCTVRYSQRLQLQARIFRYICTCCCALLSAARFIPLLSRAGLPHEAVWLSRAGMQSMLSLPCCHEGAVWGVLTVASSQQDFDYTCAYTHTHT